MITEFLIWQIFSLGLWTVIAAALNLIQIITQHMQGIVYNNTHIN